MAQISYCMADRGTWQILALRDVKTLGPTPYSLVLCTLFTDSEGRSHMINMWQYADARIWAGPELVPKLGMLGFLEVYMQVKSQRQVRRK